MAACPSPSHADRLAFANQLAEVRALDTKGEYTGELNELEVQYQFVLLRSLDLFHKEMLRAGLPEKLHAIKEKLCYKGPSPCDLLPDKLHTIKEKLNTAAAPAYQTNLPFTSRNWNILVCRQCKTRLRPRPSAHELYCENCGLLETLNSVAFDYNELYSSGDYKVVKRRRSTRRYNFRHFLDKHAKVCQDQGYILSRATIDRANEFFAGLKEHLPKQISMPFVAYKILEKIAPREEQFMRNYFWLHVPQNAVAKHEEKWAQMLRAFDVDL